MVFNLLLQSASSPNSLVGFLPILLIFGIFYFLLFRPMQRQRKQTAQMLAELKTGDNVVTRVRSRSENPWASKRDRMRWVTGCERWR